ncbi:MAG: cyclic nucleotide-binding domain-containing protein [Pirellulales bacterium]
MSHDLLSRLKQSALSEFLSAESLYQLVDHVGLQQLGAGSYLFREGEFHRFLYILDSGHIDLLMSVPGKGSLRVLTLGPGDLIAWSALLGDGIMTCDAFCREDVMLLAIDCQSLQEEIFANSGLGYELMRALASALARRLTATRLQLLDLYGHPRG